MDGAADSLCTTHAPVSTEPASVLAVLGLCPLSPAVCVPELLVGCLGRSLDVLCAALGAPGQFLRQWRGSRGCPHCVSHGFYS